MGDRRDKNDRGMNGSDEEGNDARKPIYREREEAEHIAPSELEDISLRIDPDRLPSLAPLPLPEPEKKLSPLVIGAVFSAVAAIAAAVWFFQFRQVADPQAVSDGLDAAPGAAPGVTDTPVAPDTPSLPEAPQPPEQRPSPAAPKAEQTVTFAFTVEEIARLDKPRESSAASTKAAAAPIEPANKGAGVAPEAPRAPTQEPKARTAGAQSSASTASEQPVAASVPQPQGDSVQPPTASPSGKSLAEIALGKAATSAAATAPADKPAAPSAAPPSAPGSGQSLIGVKETLDREDISAGMNKVTEDVRQCAGQRHGIAKVTLTIRNTGRVSRAVISGVFAGTPEGSCIARAVRKARFPSFVGSNVTVNYPFVL